MIVFVLFMVLIPLYDGTSIQERYHTSFYKDSMDLKSLSQSQGDARKKCIQEWIVYGVLFLIGVFCCISLITGFLAYSPLKVVDWIFRKVFHLTY